MTRLALMLALLGGCASLLQATTRNAVIYDVADVAVIGTASTFAIVDNRAVVRGTALGVDALALAMIPVLVVATLAAWWGR